MTKIFNEFEQHMLNDAKPSEYFNILVEQQRFPENYPYTLLTDLINVPQSPVHHPEGNVWYHVMMVVDIAAIYKQISNNPVAFMWAALLHDIGKTKATKIRKGKITAYDHDRDGHIPARDFILSQSGDDKLSVEVSNLVRWHMQPLYVELKLPFVDFYNMSKNVDLSEIGLLTYCDRLGRGYMTQEQIKIENELSQAFLQNCLMYISTSGREKFDEMYIKKQIDSINYKLDRLKFQPYESNLRIT